MTRRHTIYLMLNSHTPNLQIINTAPAWSQSLTETRKQSSSKFSYYVKGCRNPRCSVESKQTSAPSFPSFTGTQNSHLLRLPVPLGGKHCVHLPWRGSPYLLEEDILEMKSTVFCFFYCLKDFI